MSSSMPGNEEASSEVPPRGRIPVPTPPNKPLARARLVQQNQRSARREHEVQRVTRDLAALAIAQAR
jgi:hypothetical protein